MKLIFVSSLLVCATLCCVMANAADSPYSLSVSTTSIAVGQPVTVGWKGNCSHSTWTGCYDWVAAFQKGACSDPSALAQDTCYLRNEWTWVSRQPTNSWTFAFDGPGDYEFRIPYCGCQECQPLIADMAECPSYPTEGVSQTVRVLPPFDLTPFSPAEQYVLGIAWVLMEGKQSFIQQLLAKPPKYGSCSTCFCDVKNLVLQAQKSAADFESLLDAPSSSLFQQMTATVTDLGDLVRTVSDALNDCGINEIVGKDVLGDLLAGAAAWITGLEEVATVFKMAVSGEKVYADLSNAALSWELGNYFASGVNTARMAMVVLSASPPIAFSATSSSALPSPCMMRHPGGSWSACDCSKPLDLSQFPGNKCRKFGDTLPSPIGSPASPSPSGPSGGVTAGIVIGCVAVAALFSFAIVYVRRQKREAERSSLQTALLGLDADTENRTNAEL